MKKYCNNFFRYISGFVVFIMFSFAFGCMSYKSRSPLLCERIFLQRTSNLDTINYFKSKYMVYKNIIIVPKDYLLSEVHSSTNDSVFINSNRNNSKALTNMAEASAIDTLYLKIVDFQNKRYMYIDMFAKSASVFKKVENQDSDDDDGILPKPNYNCKKVGIFPAMILSQLLKKYDTVILGRKYNFMPANSVNHKSEKEKEFMYYLYDKGPRLLPCSFSLAPICLPLGFHQYWGFVRFGGRTQYSTIYLDRVVRKANKDEKELVAYFRNIISTSQFNKITIVDSVKLFDSTSFTVLRRKRKMELLHAEVDSVIKARNIKVIHLPN